MSPVARASRRALLGLWLLGGTLAPDVTVSQPAAQARSAQTVGALVRSARMAARAARLADTLPSQDAQLQRLAAVLDRPALDTIPLDAVARAWMNARSGGGPSLADIAHWRPDAPMALLSAEEQVAIDALAQVSVQFLPDLLDARLPEDSVDRLLAPIDAFNRARREQSLAQSLEKLRRYERRFGPGAPRLNLLEVGLNFVAQSFPPFRPSADGWPSRFEVVAAYVPSYATVQDGRAMAWTVGEFGVRGYLFGPAWGTGGMAGVLRPGHWAAGFALAADEAGALRQPWRGGARGGAFVAWGDSKLTVLGGRGPSVLLTRQLQFIPWVF